MRTITRGLALAAALAALGACHNASEPQTSHDPIGGDPRPQKPLTNPTPQKSHDPVANLIGEDDVYGPRSPASHPTPQEPQFADPKPQPSLQDQLSGEKAKQSTLSDGDVLGVTKAVNESEIEVADYAKKHASSAEVKQFSATLVTHHRDAKAKEQRVQEKTKVEVKDTDLSKQVMEDKRADLDALKSKKGKEFDRAFIEEQISSDKDTLAKIDDSLLPAAQNPEVKTHLNDLRKTIESHITQAEGIKERLGASTAPAKAKAKTGDTKQDSNILRETDTSKGNRPEDVKKDTDR